MSFFLFERFFGMFTKEQKQLYKVALLQITVLKNEIPLKATVNKSFFSKFSSFRSVSLIKKGLHDCYFSKNFVKLLKHLWAMVLKQEDLSAAFFVFSNKRKYFNVSWGNAYMEIFSPDGHYSSFNRDEVSPRMITENKVKIEWRFHAKVPSM